MRQDMNGQQAISQTAKRRFIGLYITGFVLFALSIYMFNQPGGTAMINMNPQFTDSLTIYSFAIIISLINLNTYALKVNKLKWVFVQLIIYGIPILCSFGIGFIFFTKLIPMYPL